MKKEVNGETKKQPKSKKNKKDSITLTSSTKIGGFDVSNIESTTDEALTSDCYRRETLPSPAW